MSKVIDKGLVVLSAFTVDRPRLSFDDLVKITRMPTSTLYRFLNGLLRNGYLSKDASTLTYTLGPAVLRLGRIAEAALDVRRLALPWMDRLWEQTGETIYLSARLGMTRLCLESRERKGRGIKFSIRPGETSPIYAGASGKVLLAHLPEAELKALLAKTRLVKVTPRTPADRGKILREMATIRTRGYHYTEGEYNPGAWGLAAPILNAHAAAEASISISGVLHPGSRRPPIEEFSRLLLEATRDVSERLGYSA